MLKKWAQDIEVVVLEHITRSFLVCLAIVSQAQPGNLVFEQHVMTTASTSLKLKNIIQLRSCLLIGDEGLRNSARY